MESVSGEPSEAAVCLGVFAALCDAVDLASIAGDCCAIRVFPFPSVGTPIHNMRHAKDRLPLESGSVANNYLRSLAQYPCIPKPKDGHYSQSLFDWEGGTDICSDAPF